MCPTSLQNQYSSRISDKAEPCALIHVSFLLQYLLPVSSRQLVSGNNDDEVMVMRRPLFVCTSEAGTDVLGRLSRRTTGKKPFRWFGGGELQVPQQSTELWWHEFMYKPSTMCTILWTASHPSTMEINQLFIPMRLDRRRQNGSRSKHTNSTRNEGIYTF